jgi:16S rRNA (adenine1518-N6/adenine1519-N6)-dimethyltransferase
MDQFSERETRIASRPAAELSQEVSANTFIGQHFLTDEDIYEKIIDSIPSNTKCIEIGAGPGTLTSRLLGNKNEVVTYEVDQQFRPALEDMEKDSPLEIRWSSFLDADIDALNESAPFRLVGNIPYHISEPLMFMLTRLNFESATLLVGKRLATSLQAKPESSNWGRMSLLANAYFNIQVLADVPKESFYPVPRKDGALIMLTKKEDDEIGISEATLQSIVQAGETNSTVAKALKAVEVDQSGRVAVRGGNIHKKSSNRSERRMTRIALKEQAILYSNSREMASTPQVKRITNMLELVTESGVNERILSKPLTGIDNQELRTLCIAISSIASKERARHSKKQDRTAV